MFKLSVQNLIVLNAHKKVYDIIKTFLYFFHFPLDIILSMVKVGQKPINSTLEQSKINLHLSQKYYEISSKF